MFLLWERFTSLHKHKMVFCYTNFTQEEVHGVSSCTSIHVCFISSISSAKVLSPHTLIVTGIELFCFFGLSPFSNLGSLGAAVASFLPAGTRSPLKRSVQRDGQS